MPTSDSPTLARRIGRFSASDAEERAVLLEEIRQLCNLAARESQPNLAGSVEAAQALVRLLVGENGGPGAGAGSEEVLNVLSELVGRVEEAVRAPAEDDDAAVPKDLPLIHDILLGEILVQLGTVTEDQVDEGLRLQRDTGQCIGESLICMGVATSETIQNAVDVQERLRRESGVPGDLFGAIVPNHALWKHPFLHRCRTKQLTKLDVKILAGQMYKFCGELSKILANAFARCPDEYARTIIADNLYDETGNGDEERAHPALFRRFTRALGITDEELEELRVEPETQSLIDTYLALPERCGYLGSLGAICYASQNIVAALYSQILTGIEGSLELPEESLIFFKAHVELDVDHANALINIVNRGVHTLDDSKKVLLAIKEALAARIRFFDGIERCVRQATRTGQRAQDANL